MNWRFPAALVLSVATLGAPASAEPSPIPSAEIGKYDAGFAGAQAATQTFQADLRQTLHLQGLAQPIVSVGRIYYARPDRLLLRFSQPAGEWMLLDGARVTVKKAGQLPQRRDLSGPNKAPSQAASLLDVFHGDPDRWHRSFDISMHREGDRLLVQLKPWLTPTAPSQGLDRIVTTLRLPGYDLLEIAIAINGENSIDYAFDHGVRNAPLDPALFTAP